MVEKDAAGKGVGIAGALGSAAGSGGMGREASEKKVRQGNFAG